MPNREHDELGRELGELGSRIEYPPTPDVARKVRRRLDAESAERTIPRRWLGMLAEPKRAAAAAATILLFLTALSPTMRSMLSDSVFSGASGGAGQAAGGAADEAGAPSASSSEYATEGTARSSREATSGAGGSAAGAGMPPGEDLGLGERLSTSEARSRVGDLLLPGTPAGAVEPGNFCGESERMCAGASSEGDGVVLVFGAGPGLPPLGDTDVGLLLVETPGDLDDAYPPAGRTTGARPEEVMVDGKQAYWIPDGRSLRLQPGKAEGLPGGALLWERGEVALLMRANVTKEEAIRIAESVR